MNIFMKNIMINFKIRLQSKPFLVSIISAILICVKSIAGALGYELDLGPINAVIDAVLYIFTIMGIINDPTVKTFNDSEVTMLKTDINQTAQDVLKKAA